MRRDKVISNYKDLLDDELAALAGKILGAMTGSTIFTDPVPSIIELKEAVDTYRQYHEIAIRGGSVLDNRVKNESRDKLLYVLSQLSHHVNTVADGNLPKLTSSAMILAKQPEGIRVPYVIERVVLKDGNLSGQMNVTFKAQKNIWDYEIQLGEWPDTAADVVWDKTESTTKSRGTIIAPLEPGKRYYVRVRARNSKGVGDWTEAVSMIVR